MAERSKSRRGQLYYRLQPRGTSLKGWTSEGSSEKLPDGFVFAYANVHEVVGEWWMPDDVVRDDLVMVTFYGRGEFDPGDAEGVAVLPTSAGSREEVEVWLRAQAKKAEDPTYRRGFLEAVQDVKDARRRSKRDRTPADGRAKRNQIMTPLLVGAASVIEGLGKEAYEGSMKMDEYSPHGTILPEHALARMRRKRVGKLAFYDVWLVDGEVVRDEVDPSFQQGANPGRHVYVPESDLWLEQKLEVRTATAVLIHQAVELRSMRWQGLPYDEAHAVAEAEVRRYSKRARKMGEVRSMREVVLRAIEWLKEVGYVR